MNMPKARKNWRYYENITTKLQLDKNKNINFLDLNISYYL